MKVLTTLAEKDYFLGVSALINSVVKHGSYVDSVVIGYRGELPTWLPELRDYEFGKLCTLKSGLIMKFVLVQSDLHMVHEKPRWFKYLTDVLEPDAHEYLFFDSDIIIINRMSFFGEWVKQGVALCEDVNNNMSHNHPIRKQWVALAKNNDLHVNKELDRFYNSGFLGWSRATKEFINDWQTSFEILSKYATDMTKFRTSDRTSIVQSANQDSLNLAAMVTEAPLSTMGPDAMGFHAGPKLMSHPLGPKPWRRKFLKEFFSGNSPRTPDVFFWESVNGSELTPLSNSYVRRKIYLCRILRGLARVYKRN